jgi:hypothetical protein
MTTANDLAIRPLAAADAPAVGRALIGRLTDQLQAEGRRLLVLTVSSLEEEPGMVDG